MAIWCDTVWDGPRNGHPGAAVHACVCLCVCVYGPTCDDMGPYGQLLCLLILAANCLPFNVQGGELERHGIFRRRFMDWSSGEARQLSGSPKRLLEWLLVYFPVGCSLTLFLLLSTILVEAFLGYHLYLIAKVWTGFAPSSSHTGNRTRHNITCSGFTSLRALLGSCVPRQYM